MRSGRTLVAASLLATLVVGGCSSDAAKDAATTSPSPSVDASGDAAFAKAIDGLTSAKSFRAKASSGQAAEYDIHFGTGGSETVVNTSQLQLHFVSDGTNVYLKAPATMWAQNMPSVSPQTKDKLSVLASKWVKIDVSKPEFANYGKFVNKDEFLKLMRDAGHFALGGANTVNGVKVQVLKGETGAVWYVEASAAGRLLKTSAEAGAGQSAGSTIISDYDVPFSPSLPSAADVVDYNVVAG